MGESSQSTGCPRGSSARVRGVSHAEFPTGVHPSHTTRVVHSALANDDYLISVALPFHYEERSDEVWPVIYVLDCNMHFNMVVDMVRSAVYPANPSLTGP